MATLAALSDLARSALTANQAALNAAANNVANQNTVGYVRQVVTFESGATVTLSNSRSLSTGPLVTTTSVRDRVLEQRVQQQTQTASEASARSGVLAQVEQVFSITGSSSTGGATQIGTALNSFASSLTALTANPADAATRQGVLSAAGALATAFNTADSQLAAVSAGVDSSLSSSVAQVNSLTKTIADLNRRIGATSPGGDAGTLEDQRQAAIASLSGLIGLDQVRTENNGIALTTRGGATLVTGGAAYALTATRTAAGTVIADAAGNDVTAGVTGGSIGGLVAAQRTDIPAVQTALDALAYRVATAVNTQNAAGLNAGGTAAGALFNLSATGTGAARAIALATSDPSAVGAAAVGEGATGSGNAKLLAALGTQTDASGRTAAAELAALLGDLGTQAAGVSGRAMAEQGSLTQLTTERNQLSAVSLDDEAASLQQYQRSYQAAARLFSIVDGLIRNALNLGVQTSY